MKKKFSLFAVFALGLTALAVPQFLSHANLLSRFKAYAQALRFEGCEKVTSSDASGGSFLSFGDAVDKATFFRCQSGQSLKLQNASGEVMEFREEAREKAHRNYTNRNQKEIAISDEKAEQIVQSFLKTIQVGDALKLKDIRRMSLGQVQSSQSGRIILKYAAILHGKMTAYNGIDAHVSLIDGKILWLRREFRYSGNLPKSTISPPAALDIAKKNGIQAAVPKSWVFADQSLILGKRPSFKLKATYSIQGSRKIIFIDAETGNVLSIQGFHPALD